ncbi:universal stress protein [Arthrobacter sp. 35W]|uniref:universal stress protein n=1 Tax=Arthrobacter sp. 35W TaxID=1132441 RepID=UPI00041D79B1|nr:universal stress protein [Arthrobacter sp. 35W]
MMENASSRPRHPVVVGVAPGQAGHIVRQAAAFAARFGTELVCAHVNQGRYPVAEAADGSVSSASIDPDFADDEAFDADLAAALAELLLDTQVPWRTVALAGEVSTALARLAHTLDAAMIVVGTHQHSVGGSVQEFFNRSVATHLAHRQERPVVVVPARSPRASQLPFEAP